MGTGFPFRGRLQNGNTHYRVSNQIVIKRGIPRTGVLRPVTATL
jgi:hypothetical protein